MLLDSRLSFNEYVQSKINKCYKIIGLIKKVPREALLRIYKSFVRPTLDYDDITFDKLNNESFKIWIESIQYKACTAITGTIQGTSRERLYRELGLGFLSDRCWFRKFTFFYKIVKSLFPRYLTKYVKLRSILITRPDLQILKTIYKNFPAELKALSILFCLFVIENGTNQTTPYEMLNLLNSLNRCW